MVASDVWLGIWTEQEDADVTFFLSTYAHHAGCVVHVWCSEWVCIHGSLAVSGSGLQWLCLFCVFLLLSVLVWWGACDVMTAPFLTCCACHVVACVVLR